MGKMRDIMMMYAMAGMIGSGEKLAKSKQQQAEHEAWLKKRVKEKAKNLPKSWNGEQSLHSFTINGVEIKAADKKTARKIYNLHHKK